MLILHCKNKIVNITNSFVSTVARNNGNCNLIGYVGLHADIEYTCIYYTTNYNPIITVSISLYGLIDYKVLSKIFDYNWYKYIIMQS